MDFWKEHAKLRVAIIALFFVLGLVLVVSGWKMTGKLAGLGIMVLGVIFLLAALMVYNKPYETPSRRD